MIPKRYLFNVCTIATLVYTVALAFYILQNGYFITDDYQHFYKINTMSFVEYVFTPINHHVGPLHRLLAYVTFKIAPLNYPVAVVVLLVFHVLTLLALYRLLDFLHRSRVNELLVFTYAVNLFLGNPLIWWCAGIMRFPYVLLTILCIHHYLLYRQTERRRELYLALALFATGLGFFSRTILVPVFLFGLDLCLIDRVSLLRLWRSLVAVFPFVAGSILYVFLFKMWVPVDYFRADWHHLAGFMSRAWAVLGYGLLGLIYQARETSLNLIILYLWAGFFLYTVARQRRNLVIWLVGLGCLGVGYLLIAASPISLLGADLAEAPRYHFDLVFLVPIFLCLILGNLEKGTATAQAPAQLGGTRISGILLGALVISYAVWLALAQSAIITKNMPFLPATKTYMTNLSAGLARLQADPPPNLSFVDGEVPGYLVIMCEYLAPYSKFLRIFGLQATFGTPTENCYAIDAEGHVRRVEPEQMEGNGRNGGP